VSGSFKCRFPPLGELTALPKSVSWIWGATSRQGEGKGVRGKERK